MLEYSYPDAKKASFLCSDENLNRLYVAAKKTLLLNTLDIFMDCPDRERGGWLCDSLWTARAAALMLSDTAVEREHLENFLLTDPEEMFHAFFPEAYPASKASFKDMTGITTWSFWLACELCEYIKRTQDFDFRDQYADRVAKFVEGTKYFIGEHGLLENMPWVFIDWSISNDQSYNSPVSTAANSLYAYMLIELGLLYDRKNWTEQGREIRSILKKAFFEYSGDRFLSDALIPDGKGDLVPNGKCSEACVYTVLWSGLFEKDEKSAYAREVRDCMGPSPLFSPSPDIGRSSLFIGLCIRLDMLARFGEADKLIEDMKAIYYPQLAEGPGTLWENVCVDTTSRCHGFNSHAGVHLVRDILGIDYPSDGIIRIAPHICNLRWARGAL